MDRAEYNAKVQDMQEFCIAAGLEHRVSAYWNDDRTECQAHFEVYYGKWRVLGYEFRAMRPDCSRRYYDDEDARIRFTVARDITQ